MKDGRLFQRSTHSSTQHAVTTVEPLFGVELTRDDQLTMGVEEVRIVQGRSVLVVSCF